MAFLTSRNTLFFSCWHQSYDQGRIEIHWGSLYVTLCRSSFAKRCETKIKQMLYSLLIKMSAGVLVQLMSRANCKLCNLWYLKHLLLAQHIKIHTKRPTLLLAFVDYHSHQSVEVLVRSSCNFLSHSFCF